MDGASLGAHALEIFHAGLSAADPELRLGEVDLELPAGEGRLLVLGAGKASAHLAAAVEKRLVETDYEGRVVVKHGHGFPLRRLVVEEGGHPLPDEASVLATEHLLEELTGLTPKDRVLFLLTGGASSLLVAPAPGISLADKVGVTDGLLRCGATIQELNTVRKHLSRVKGGRLLQRIAPARVQTLLVSDVIGDDLSSIGSGPTAADPTTFADAIEVLAGYGLGDRVAASVLEHLDNGAAGRLPETPKPGDEIVGYGRHRILASNRDCVAAAAEAARRLGYSVEVFAHDMVGSVHERAVQFSEALAERAASSTPVALLAGGELTLEVTGGGVGGRSQEFAMVAARELSGVADVVVLAAGTDGTDGPTDAAGAHIDGNTWEAARERGLDPKAYLTDNDSYHFFERMQTLVKTGPTGTNVNDLVVGLSCGAASSD